MPRRPLIPSRARPALAAVSLLGASLPCVPDAFAAGTQRAGGPYAEVQLGASGVRYAELDFVSPIAGVSVGAYLFPGIGLELFADGALDRGGASRFESGVNQAYGAAVRLRSPSEDGLHGYIVLGYVDFVVEQESLDRGIEIDERFTGLRSSIGLMQRLERVPSLAVTAEYRNFYVDEAIQVDGLSLGLRFDMW